MPKQVTIAAKNRYCQARMRAAQYNDQFASRAGAAEAIPGVSEDSLKKYELDIVNPPNDVVALMADAYNEPELRNWYCAHQCPLGKDSREIEFVQPERTAMRLFNTISDMQKTTEKLFDILDDGTIDEKEKQSIPELREQFVEVRKRIDEMLALMEKMERRKGGSL